MNNIFLFFLILLLFGCSINKEIMIKYHQNDNDIIKVSLGNNEAIEKMNIYEPVVDNNIFISNKYYIAKKINISENILYSNKYKYYYKHPFLRGNVVLFFRTSGLIGNNVFLVNGVDDRVKYILNTSMILRHNIYINDFMIKKYVYPYFKINGFSLDFTKNFVIYHELSHGGVWQEWLSNSVPVEKFSLARELAADIGSFLYLVKAYDLNKNKASDLLNSIIRFRRGEEKSHLVFSELMVFNKKYLLNLDKYEYVLNINQYEINKFANKFAASVYQ